MPTKTKFLPLFLTSSRLEHRIPNDFSVVFSGKLCQSPVVGRRTEQEFATTIFVRLIRAILSHSSASCTVGTDRTANISAAKIKTIPEYSKNKILASVNKINISALYTPKNAPVSQMFRTIVAHQLANYLIITPL